MTVDYRDLANDLLTSIKKDSDVKNCKPFFKYVGSKFKFAPIICPLMPEHQVYCEPFMGSAALFIAKDPKAKTNILNDYNSHLYNLFQVVRDAPEELINWCQYTPYSEEMQKKILGAYSNHAVWSKLSRVKQAGGYLYLLRLAFNGEICNFNNSFNSIARFKGSHQEWNLNITKYIYEVSKKLNNVIILNRPYIDVFSDTKINTKDTFFYMDPPYTITASKGYYEHNFNPSSHQELRKRVDLLQGNWMMSYDDSPFIRKLYEGFHILPLESAGLKDEIIITNYDPIKR